MSNEKTKKQESRKAPTTRSVRIVLLRTKATSLCIITRFPVKNKRTTIKPLRYFREAPRIIVKARTLWINTQLFTKIVPKKTPSIENKTLKTACLHNFAQKTVNRFMKILLKKASTNSPYNNSLRPLLKTKNHPVWRKISILILPPNKRNSFNCKSTWWTHNNFFWV